LAKQNSLLTRPQHQDKIVALVSGNWAIMDPLSWSCDEDIWLRRLAIDHQLLRKEETDTELLEKILINNLGQTSRYFK